MSGLTLLYILSNYSVAVTTKICFRLLYTKQKQIMFITLSLNNSGMFGSLEKADDNDNGN